LRNRGLSLATDLKSFFEDEIRLTLSRQGVGISPPTVEYLASVLAKFGDTKNLLKPEDFDENGQASRQGLPTLALLWLEGLANPAPFERLVQMQHLGDVSLFMTGFFAENLERRALDMDYSIAMGARAYETAGKIRESLAAERTLNVYFELASEFRRLVEVFAEVSDRAKLHDAKALLRLYERWLETKRPRLHRMLAEEGIIAAERAFENGPSDPRRKA